MHSVLLLICNDPKIMGNRINTCRSNFFSWLTVALMGAAALFLLFAMVTGRA